MSDSRESMTLTAFDDGLLRWGSDIARWPDNERTRAEALIASNAEARSMLAEEQDISGVLATALAVDMQPAPLAARVQQSVNARRENSGLARLLRPIPIMAGVTAAIACGVALGLLFPLAPDLNPDALLVTVLGGGLI
jgi:hypothetical protein